MQRKINLIELDRSNSAHLETMYAIRTHPEVDSYLTGSPPANFTEHVAYLQRSQKKFYLIQTDSSLCGYCQLTSSPEHVELGMALHPQYCNQGIGSATLPLLLEIAREMARDKPLILLVKEDNMRARALYAKFGFKINNSVDETKIIEMSLKKTNFDLAE